MRGHEPPLDLGHRVVGGLQRQGEDVGQRGGGDRGHLPGATGGCGARRLAVDRDAGLAQVLGEGLGGLHGRVLRVALVLGGRDIHHDRLDLGHVLLVAGLPLLVPLGTSEQGVVQAQGDRRRPLGLELLSSGSGEIAQARVTGRGVRVALVLGQQHVTAANEGEGLPLQDGLGLEGVPRPHGGQGGPGGEHLVGGGRRHPGGGRAVQQLLAGGDVDDGGRHVPPGQGGVGDHSLDVAVQGILGGRRSPLVQAGGGGGLGAGGGRRREGPGGDVGVGDRHRAGQQVESIAQAVVAAENQQARRCQGSGLDLAHTSSGLGCGQAGMACISSRWGAQEVTATRAPTCRVRVYRPQALSCATLVPSIPAPPDRRRPAGTVPAPNELKTRAKEAPRGVRRHD